MINNNKDEKNRIEIKVEDEIKCDKIQMK